MYVPKVIDVNPKVIDFNLYHLREFLQRLQDPDILQLALHRLLLGLLGLLGLLQPAAAWMGSLWTTSQETHTEGLGHTSKQHVSMF